MLLKLNPRGHFRIRGKGSSPSPKVNFLSKVSPAAGKRERATALKVH